MALPPPPPHPPIPPTHLPTRVRPTLLTRRRSVSAVGGDEDARVEGLGVDAQQLGHDGLGRGVEGGEVQREHACLGAGPGLGLGLGLGLGPGPGLGLG